MALLEKIDMQWSADAAVLCEEDLVGGEVLELVEDDNTKMGAAMGRVS
jgi:hypothetical protein